jgi:hypothetical protein
MRSNKLFWMSLAMSGAMLLGWGGTARAQSSCSNRVRQDQRELDQAVDRYGYNSKQAEHERGELQRDAANCRYDDYGARNYNDGNRNDWQNRNDGDRDDRYYNGRGDNGRYDGSYGRSSPAYDNGYRDGVAIGQRDSQKRKSFNPQKNDQFEDADRGYNKSYGDKNQYKSEYRQGFQSGYAEGYRRR